MNKRKVKELIEKAIQDLSATDMGILYTQSTLQQALEELSKSDWVSVEDELPPYDEDVWVTDRYNTDFVMKTSRIKSKPCWNIDKNGFLCSPASHVTHWKPIEKLEE